MVEESEVLSIILPSLLIHYLVKLATSCSTVIFSCSTEQESVKQEHVYDEIKLKKAQEGR